MQFFKNWGTVGEGVQIFIPNKFDLTFQIKIAAVGVFTDRLTDRRK